MGALRLEQVFSVLFATLSSEFHSRSDSRWFGWLDNCSLALKCFDFQSSAASQWPISSTVVAVITLETKSSLRPRVFVILSLKIEVGC